PPPRGGRPRKAGARRPAAGPGPRCRSGRGRGCPCTGPSTPYRSPAAATVAPPGPGRRRGRRRRGAAAGRRRGAARGGRGPAPARPRGGRGEPASGPAGSWARASLRLPLPVGPACPEEFQPRAVVRLARLVDQLQGALGPADRLGELPGVGV